MKDSEGRRLGPGDNYFGRQSVSLANDGLHLRVQERDGRLECGEVILGKEPSYGTYRFTVATDLTRLGNSLTFGMFLWSDDPEFAHREIDVEAGRWGDVSNDDMQFVLQPFSVPGNMLRFPLGVYRGPSVQNFSWRPGRIDFETINGGTLVRRFSVTRGIPPTGGRQRVRLNLWNASNPFARDGLREVVVDELRLRAIAIKSAILMRPGGSVPTRGRSWFSLGCVWRAVCSHLFLEAGPN